MSGAWRKKKGRGAPPGGEERRTFRVSGAWEKKKGRDAPPGGRREKNLRCNKKQDAVRHPVLLLFIALSPLTELQK